MMRKLFYLIGFLFILLNFACKEIPNQKNDSLSEPAVLKRNSEKIEPKDMDISPGALKNAKERIVKVVYHSNNLWVLGQNGVLFSVDLNNKKASAFKFAQYVADIFINKNGELFLLASSEKNSQVWQILRKESQDWFSVGKLNLNEETGHNDKGDERVIGLTEFQNRFLILTKNAIYLEQENNDWKTVNLQPETKIGLQTPFAVTDDGFVYFGLNFGEFGGGLRQINLKTGDVKNIEKKTQGEICFRPLYAGCDPVTSVIRDTEDPSAVLAGIGLSHFSQQGRIVKVTQDDVSVVLNKTYRYDYKTGNVTPENPCDGKNEPENLENFESEGVFGMQSDGKSIWLVTGRAIYKINAGQIESCSELPKKFDEIDGILINENISGIILIGTDVNSAKSMSGTTPLIAIKR